MSVTTPTLVSAGPSVPSSADPEATFDAAYEAFNTWERDTLRPGMNALATVTYDNAVDAAASASSASSSASTASGHASSASGSATLAQAWASQASTPVSGGVYSAKYYAEVAQGALAVLPAGTINDATTTTSSVWSSSKVSTDLAGKASTASVAAKQDALVSGTSIKTVGGTSLLGSGDVPFPTTLFSAVYTSADQTLTAAGLLTLAHGLGATPTLIQLFLKCSTANASHSVGDMVPVAMSTSNIGPLCTLTFDSTNVSVRFASVLNLTLPDKTSGSATALTSASWKLVVRAWK